MHYTARQVRLFDREAQYADACAQADRIEAAALAAQPGEALARAVATLPRRA